MDRELLFSQLQPFWLEHGVSLTINNNREIDLKSKINDHHLFITFMIEIAEYDDEGVFMGGLGVDHFYDVLDRIKNLEGAQIKEGGMVNFKTKDKKVEIDMGEDELDKIEIHKVQYLELEVYFGALNIFDIELGRLDKEPMETNITVS